MNYDPAMFDDTDGLCKPWEPSSVTTDGTCQRCWMRDCSCYEGCWECGADPGQPGCQHCWHADTKGYRRGWWNDRWYNEVIDKPPEKTQLSLDL